MTDSHDENSHGSHADGDLTSGARICVPVCVRHAGELAERIARVARDADVIEIRFDYLKPIELDAALDNLPNILDSCARPLIFTLRPPAQGGARAVSAAERESFWRRLATELKKQRAGAGDSNNEYFADLELDAELSEETRTELAASCALICSHHDFSGVPEELTGLYERMTATGALILKIAVTARDAMDCIPVFRLLERARGEGREIIAVAMGQAGFPTRVLAPSRGALLTYAALDEESATAPGQIRADDLRSLYRVGSIDGRTILTGVVGSPVTHSLSPHMHNRAFTSSKLNAVYLPFEVVDVSAFLSRMVRPRTRELDWNLRGLSVTAPHKTAVLTHLDWVEPRAREIGAVNTIVVEGEELRGYNTDAEAFLSTLGGLIETRVARFAVIGAGGAARAVLWGLAAGGARATVFARNSERAGEAAKDFGASSAPLEGACFDGFDVVVNTTPLGTRGPLESKTPATVAQLRGARIAYDLVYNPQVTRFLREARAAGCETMGGLPVLVAQAGEQFRLWTGRDAPLDAMREAAERQLLGEEAEARP